MKFNLSLKSFYISKTTCTLLCIIYVNNVYAIERTKTLIDIYKTNQLSLNDISDKLRQKINNYAEIISLKENMKPGKNINHIYQLMKKIISEINTMGNFSYIGLSPTMYQGNKTIYITIDIVDVKDKHRLAYFLPSPTKNIPDPDGLIKTWKEYEKIGLSIFLKDKKFPSFKSCPAHHCVFGFDEKGLKKYKDIFNTLVPKNKKQLIKVLRFDKDENKRASAAFLLAHLKDSNEVISALTPFIYDASSTVRNNVMRVIGLALTGTKSIKFPIEKLVTALNFPMLTDRNKALVILSALVDNPIYAAYLRKHASKMLVEELKMLQPNVHQPAYKILKKISGQNYSEYDIKSWQQWLNSV